MSAAFGPESDTFKITPLDQVLPCYVEEKEYRCGLPATTLAVTSAMLLLIVAYFVLYCFFLFRAMGQLRANPNVEFKLANTIVRIQVRVHLSWVKILDCRIVKANYALPSKCSYNLWRYRMSIWLSSC